MDNIREKLVELMIEAKKADHEDAPFSEFLADFMIANGVTIQEWIPVSERLPEKCVTVLVCSGDPQYIDTDFYDGWREVWYKYGKCVTHWMPLPTPPKGE